MRETGRIIELLGVMAADIAALRARLAPSPWPLSDQGRALDPLVEGVMYDSRPPNLTCHDCRKQVPHDWPDLAPCPACGAPRDRIWL